MARRIGATVLTRKLLEVEGIPELEDRVNRYLAGVTRDPATIKEIKSKAFMPAALTIRDEIRDLAPKGKTLNLVNSIFAAYGKPGKSDVLVGVNYRRAPHAHLVEFGTDGRRSPKKKKFLRFTIDGHVIYAKSVAPMPRQPFFRPGVVAARPLAARMIADGLRAVLATEWRAK